MFLLQLEKPMTMYLKACIYLGTMTGDGNGYVKDDEFFISEERSIYIDMNWEDRH